MVIAAGLPEPVSQKSIDILILSPAALDMAEQLGVLPLVGQLEQSKFQSAHDLNSELKFLKLQQQLNSKIMIAMLQVRDVTARIERELAGISKMRGLLQDKRDRAIKLNSIENVVASGGLTEIGQSNAFLKNAVPSQIVQLVAGGITIGLGGLALRQQSGGKQKVMIHPNMLSRVFNMPTNKDADYSEFVWDYLNRAPVGTNQTRLQSLIESWQRFNMLPPNLKNPAGRNRIGILTNTYHNGTANIDIFEDQFDMLCDLRTEVFQMDRDLLDLAQCTQQQYLQ